jgi:class 3 adenylate cyclase
LKVSTASRATRVLRIIRIIRLIRIVKLYKTAVQARENIAATKKQLEEERTRRVSVRDDHSPDNITIKGADISKYGFNIGRRKSAFTINSQQGRRSSYLLMLKRSRSMIQDGDSNNSNFNNNHNANPGRVKKDAEASVDNITIDKLAKESKISKILSELITKKVIILILIMLIIFPLLSDDFYSDDSNGCYSLMATYIVNYRALGSLSLSNNSNLLSNVFSDGDLNYPIVNITIDNDLYFYNETYKDNVFRNDEVNYATSDDGRVNIVYSILADTHLAGLLNIIKTVYICILLTLAAIIFENDTKELVLEPLEVMIEIVDNVSKDPIGAKNTEKIQEGFKNTISKLSNKKKRRKEEQIEKYEVKIIQSAIVKISALLAIGFGEAGGEIIKENLSGYQDLDPMLKGKRKNAIFGFCDIRNFSTINEILQEKTMVFVNEVADIVHSSVDRYGGAANKNIGDAFLMVWPMSYAEDQNGEALVNIYHKGSSKKISLSECQMADMAVLGFLKVIIRINKDKRILAYRNDPGIMSNLPDYKVNMGFGLHLGWAIEGAIGSNFKIDASYLSPNVNMSARLEAATRQYGVTILISGQLYDHLSLDLKEICRHIDTVEVKGSKIPLRLYTIDVNLDLRPSTKKYILTPRQRKELYENKRSDLLRDLEEYGNITHLVLAKRSFRDLLHTKIPKKFTKLFPKAMNLYIKGDWEEAAPMFYECGNIYPSDKPTRIIIEYIRDHNFKAPSDWKGFRTLTSK